MSIDSLLGGADLDSMPSVCPNGPKVKAGIKVEPEDFIVEEIPAYEPSGEGEHLYLWVQKRDISGSELIKRISNSMGIPHQEIGTAGTKDRRAVTRQWISIPGNKESRIGYLAGTQGIEILAAKRHGNKLRTGHLWGNRFQILLRDAALEQLEELKATAKTLGEVGFFNLFGTQRFGRDVDNLHSGLALLTGESKRPRLNRFQHRMVVSSLQSALFNLYLQKRVVEGLEQAVMLGDVMAKVETGGLFHALELEVEQARFEKGETCITGPIYGHRMKTALEKAAIFESDFLQSFGLTLEAFKVFGQLADGSRRPLRVKPLDLIMEPHENGIQLSFALPKGSYATVLLREFVNDQNLTPEQE